jgi:hypothetical protein
MINILIQSATRDTCTICKQSLIKSNITNNLYHQHESISDCLVALADRLKENESDIFDLKYKIKVFEKELDKLDKDSTTYHWGNEG